MPKARVYELAKELGVDSKTVCMPCLRLNARLAAKLTGWKIGIESAEAHAKKMAEAQASTSGETAE